MVQRSTMNDFLSLYMPSFFVFLGMSIVGPSLPLYAKSFGVSYTLVSLAISMYAFGRLIADLPMGILADRIGGRRLTVLGTVIMSAGALGNYFAPDFLWFIILRFVQGIGSSMWQTARTTLLADMLKPEERGRVMGYFSTFMLLGGAAGPTVGGFVGEWWGVKAPFLAYFIAGVASTLLSFFFLIEPPRKTQTSSHIFSIKYVRHLLSIRAFTIATIASFAAFLLMTGIRGTTFSLYANTVLRLDQVSIGTILTYASLTNLFLTMPVGYLVDYYGRKSITWIALFLSGISCLIFPFTTDYLTLSLAAVFMGIATIGSQQAPMAMVTDATDNEPRGISMGVFRFFGDISFILGPILTGMIADAANLRMPFYFMAAIMFISAVIVAFFGVETYSRRKNEQNKKQ
ncbi:MFS transporter [Candidatus Bathyarchaeota archaeon]|nr:MFS transporter [Candidatus Bathyarchaeota archaeon]